MTASFDSTSPARCTRRWRTWHWQGDNSTRSPLPVSDLGARVELPGTEGQAGRRLHPTDVSGASTRRTSAADGSCASTLGTDRSVTPTHGSGARDFRLHLAGIAAADGRPAEPPPRHQCSTAFALPHHRPDLRTRTADLPERHPGTPVAVVPSDRSDGRDVRQHPAEWRQRVAERRPRNRGITDAAPRHHVTGPRQPLPGGA